MNRSFLLFISLLLPLAVLAESGKSVVPIPDLIRTYSQTHNQKVLVDPKVKGRVQLYGQNPAELSFSDLLTVLDLHGYTAYREAGFIIVIPDKSARSSALQIVEGDKTYPANLHVTEVIPVEKDCAPRLIPILRPLVPQRGHMAASRTANSIILTDSYGNIQRIKRIIEQLDNRLKKPVKCDKPKK